MSNRMIALQVPELPSVDPNCPRCKSALTDPNGLGWCTKCGYCRSIEEERQVLKNLDEPVVSKKSYGGLIEVGQTIGGLPEWFWICLTGAIGFFVVSFVPNWQLPKDSLERAVWTSCQIIFGVLIALGGQLWAVVQIAPRVEGISFKDAVLPFRLYPLICKRLPRLQLSLWLGVWGLALILGGAFVVGGLDHYLTYLPGQKNNPKIDKIEDEDRAPLRGAHG